MNAQQFISQFKIWSREGKRQVASNSEVRRWCNNKAVLFNAEPVEWDDEIDFPIISVVLFPNGKRITLW